MNEHTGHIYFICERNDGPDVIVRVHDELVYSELVDAFVSFSKGVGYMEKTIKEYVDSEVI
jgi:hypothetical protein